MSDKPNCYRCVHRGTIPGDAHSCCKHPELGDAVGDPIANLMAIFAGVGRADAVMLRGRLNVKGTEYGIRNGWFNWPWSFDPTWLLSCDGFEGKGAG